MSSWLLTSVYVAIVCQEGVEIFLEHSLLKTDPEKPPLVDTVRRKHTQYRDGQLDHFPLLSFPSLLTPWDCSNRRVSWH